MAVLKYELITDALRQRIADGEFGPDYLLPSQRDLCAQWKVSRATVIKAYDALERDGLVVARQGQGYHVAPIPLARPAGGRKPEPAGLLGDARSASSVHLSARSRRDGSRPRSAWRRGRPHCAATAWSNSRTAHPCPSCRHGFRW